ncbi:chromosome transmission fidelity protein 18 homolog isoform X3 [Dendrobium catenatum]|uniref:chromosome transmission fidelity protein 18 homolog isoform X3 n=1 Tax=Dendrobium catenatum TaxID=906689 RepID=UPI00109FF491|nr:chromosome transmission fidelity protein 18 homolog isoform X3 [Dendrobium catenatum]
MDEEQLIPHADELEWLETNSFLVESEGEDDLPFIAEEIRQDDGDLPFSAALPRPHESQVSRKRSWSEEDEGSENIGEIIKREESGNKRRALDFLEREQDEDWLRYSPPQKKAPAVHIASESDVLMVEPPVKEKILSRFAVEIEGDCVPPTSLPTSSRSSHVEAIPRVISPHDCRTTRFESLKGLRQRGLRPPLFTTKILSRTLPLLPSSLSPCALDSLLSDRIGSYDTLIGSNNRSSPAVKLTFSPSASPPAPPGLFDFAPPTYLPVGSKLRHFDRSREQAPALFEVNFLPLAPPLRPSMVVRRRSFVYVSPSPIGSSNGNSLCVRVVADKKAKVEKPNSTQQSLSEFSSRRGKNSATLLRPVICICNDLYAPALRPLRQIARVHMFVQPTISRVVNRLKYVCQKEGLKTNSIALAALAEYTECDIRSCLNTLQFLNKKKETLNILEVGSQVVGHKDISRSCIDIWNKIFQNGKSNRAKSSTTNLNGHGDFEFMYSLLSNRGDYDLTMGGIHENFLRLSYIDPMMIKTVTCLDMLGVSDSLHQYIMRTQQMSLNAFQPPFAIAIKRLIALVDKPNIEWPKSIQRYRAMSLERKDLLKNWQSKISPIISRHLSTEYFAEDFVSHFLHILVPPTLRPIALHLFSEREKDDLAQLVDTMVSYSITYKNSKAEPLKGAHNNGTAKDVSILILDPPIGDFINFKDYQPTHLELSLAMKQVLLHEVEKQRILRENSGRSLNPGNECNKDSQDSTITKLEVLHDIITKSASVKGNDKPRLAMLKLENEDNHKNLNSKSKKIVSNTSVTAEVTGDLKKPSRPISFFDRFRQGCNIDSKNHVSNLQKAATAERDSRPFLFKYNEGFTNAVKRSVKIRDLLL